MWLKESRELFVGFISSHNIENKKRIYSHLCDGKWETNELTIWKFIELPDGLIKGLL